MMTKHRNSQNTGQRQEKLICRLHLWDWKEMILMNCNPVGCFSPLGYFRFYRGANDFVSHALDFFFFNPWWDSLLTCISPSLFKAVSSSFFFFLPSTRPFWFSLAFCKLYGCMCMCSCGVCVCVCTCVHVSKGGEILNLEKPAEFGESYVLWGTIFCHVLWDTYPAL